ncbi:hypothetical protein JCM19992_04660 [Thermostilla marina]
MDRDLSGEFRNILEQDPPQFTDRVDTPWDDVPDCEDFNQKAFRHIVRALKTLCNAGEKAPDATVPPAPGSRGVLVLGEAGTGKTHLLMRVAKKLAQSNHILFVRKPNNEEAVAQHVWTNIIQSLSRVVPHGDHLRSQLDVLLAHVFSDVLIPEFERDLENGAKAAQRKKWAQQLRNDPYNLFRMLGKGRQRQQNMESIRRRTLQYLQVRHPEVDQKIARALITYCFVSSEEHKRLLLTWLAGEEIDEKEARRIGLPAAWVQIDETSSEVATQQQREELALRAIRSLGILSTHYQPLILAFDQLEGLRNEERLTQRWGDVVREIFTMTPNLLIVTCIFPSLWEDWFKKVLDKSVLERLSQRRVELEPFQPHHGLALLRAQLRSHFVRYRLPTEIYPFEEEDVHALCAGGPSPRMFIQRAQQWFDDWLDLEEEETPAILTESESPGRDAIDSVIRSALEKFRAEELKRYDKEVPVEQDFFGRVRSIFQSILREIGCDARFEKAAHGRYVMPPNFIVKSPEDGKGLCIAVMNSTGNAFAHRIKNLLKTQEAGDQYKALIILRDRRHGPIGPKSQEYLDTLRKRGAVFIRTTKDETCLLNAFYEALTAAEEQDLSVGTYKIEKGEVVAYVRQNGLLRETELFQTAGRLSPVAAAVVGAE